mmetsp:Transcript_7920/g.22688  ORF Transcript_7920/g.22688 Transcript_7920/m.22688 type:complete len:222 (-) Transcript_7920:56-721(-)
MLRICKNLLLMLTHSGLLRPSFAATCAQSTRHLDTCLTTSWWLMCCSRALTRAVVNPSDEKRRSSISTVGVPLKFCVMLSLYIKLDKHICASSLLSPSCSASKALWWFSESKVENLMRLSQWKPFLTRDTSSSYCPSSCRSEAPVPLGSLLDPSPRMVTLFSAGAGGGGGVPLSRRLSLVRASRVSSDRSLERGKRGGSDAPPHSSPLPPRSPSLPRHCSV